MRRIWIIGFIAILLVIGLPAVAFAHGEDAQEAWLRQRAVGWYDVEFEPSTDNPDDAAVVQVGDEITLRGTAEILPTWPRTLPEPETGYISVVSPGPVVLLKARTVNGVDAPHSFEVEKGGIYEFEITLQARRPGRWHLHPMFAVHHAGSLVGPGQWFEVQGDGAAFTNEVTLASTGATIDLEQYGRPLIWGFHWIGFLIGLAWMLYWTVPKRTVTRLAVTSQIPLNTDGKDIGLITDRDHRNMNWFLLVTLALVTVGWIYALNAFPDRMPQQVLRKQIPSAEVVRPAVAAGQQAVWNTADHTMTITVDVTNEGDSPLALQGFASANFTFWNEAVDPDADHTLVASVDEIAPGATETIEMTIPNDAVWEQNNMLPLGEAVMTIGGSLLFEGSQAPFVAPLTADWEV